jgi:hypothetical protein
MSNEKQSNGYALGFNKPCSFKHYLGGSIELNGAECPNCNKDLILHASLDTDDKRLSLYNKTFKQLPLLYCMRCELSWHDFQYQILSDNEVKIIKYNEGGVLEEWSEEVGLDSFPSKTFSLMTIPKEVQALYNKLNGDEELSEEDELLICNFTGNFADEELGGYPIIDVSNQIGGRAYLSQGLHDPECSICGKNMPFLASLTNDEKSELRITFDSVQIVFFYCSSCCNIHVQHSM